MRVTIAPQMKLGEVDIANIQIDSQSRDDIPRLLKGFQALYYSHQSRNKVFHILQQLTGEKVDNNNNGRPGMSYCQILVLGTLKLTIDSDYDPLAELANHHDTIRGILGYPFCDDHQYKIQTLVDNLHLLHLKF